MKDLEDKLKEKGWTKRDISKSMRILKKAHKKKTKDILILDKLMDFFISLLMIAATFTVSLYLIPVMIVLESSLLFFFLLFIIAFAIGLIFEFLVAELEKFEKKHHVLFSFLVPFTAFVNLMIVTHISNVMTSELRLIRPLHNSLLIALVYIAGFVLPYVFSHLKKKY